MPTYQYECQACGHEFEVMQGMSEAKLIKCPKCSKKKLARLIGGGSGLIFKGSGFYATDYKKKDSSSAASLDKPAQSTVKPSGGCGGGCACHPG